MDCGSQLAASRSWKCAEKPRAIARHVSFIREQQPDLVIVDLTLRESNGLSLIEWIRRERSATKVIVLSMHDERDYGERALRAGAAAYVRKQASARTILIAIDRVLEGKLFFGNDLTERLAMLATSGNRVVDPSPVSSLSDRELEIVSLIGTGLSTVQIGQRLHLSPSTVGTYRERLKTKLRLKNSIELSRFATLWIAENR